MTDISLVVSISRTLLGLGALNLNDNVSYRVTSLLGTQVTWARTQATSAYMDGDVTVNRRRANVMEPLVLEVFGGTQIQLQANLDAALAAMVQDRFTMDVTVGGVLHGYYCEAADYQVAWVGYRFVAKQLTVAFTVPRRPIPRVGAS